MKRLLLALAAASILQAQIKLPPYTRDVLPNGTVVYLMPKSGLPLLELRILVKGGEESEPAGMAGLASVTAELLRRGTEKRTADQFSQQVDSLGCAFETDTDQQSTVVTAEFLSKDLDAALGLIADAVLHPVFPQAEVQKLIARRVDSVKSMKDEPREAIQQYYRSYYFGSAHPYGRVPDEATLDRLRREDVVAYHRKAYAGKNLVVIAAGDFEPEAARAAIANLFGATPSGAGYTWAPTPTQTPGGPRMLLVDHPGATQTYFLIAQPGIERGNPDRVPLILVNTLFGGRFTSMMNDALRVSSGLTYGAFSHLQQSRLQGGLAIQTFTKTETTEKAIDVSLDVLKRLRNPGLTAEQLASAKAYVKGVYPTRRLETADQLATVLGDLELFGLDRSDIDDFFARIDAVTLEQANAIANKYYRDDKLTFVLLGDAGKIRGVVKKYAPSVVEKSTTKPGW